MKQFDEETREPVQDTSCPSWKKIPDVDISDNLYDIGCTKSLVLKETDVVSVTDIDNPSRSTAKFKFQVILSPGDVACLPAVNRVTGQPFWVETSLFSIEYKSYLGRKAALSYWVRGYDEGEIETGVEKIDIQVPPPVGATRGGDFKVLSHEFAANGTLKMEVEYEMKAIQYHYGIIENFVCTYSPLETDMHSLMCKITKISASSEEGFGIMRMVEDCHSLYTEEVRMTAGSSFVLSLDNIAHKQKINVCTEYGLCKQYEIQKDASASVWMLFWISLFFFVTSVIGFGWMIHDYRSIKKRRKSHCLSHMLPDLKTSYGNELRQRKAIEEIESTDTNSTSAVEFHTSCSEQSESSGVSDDFVTVIPPGAKDTSSEESNYASHRNTKKRTYHTFE